MNEGAREDEEYKKFKKRSTEEGNQDKTIEMFRNSYEIVTV